MRKDDTLVEFSSGPVKYGSKFSLGMYILGTHSVPYLCL